MSEAREILGFLCRWVLMGLAAMSLAGLAAFCVAHASPIRDEGDVIMPEAVWNGQGDFYLRGRLSGGLFHRKAPLLLGAVAGEPYLVGSSDERVYYLPVRGAREGMNTVVFRGLPYGPAAEVRGSTRVLVVAPAQRVFLLDDRIPIRQGTASLPGLLAALHSRGQVVLFTGHGAQDWTRERADLFGMGMRQVLVPMPDTRESWLRVLRLTAQSLGRPPSALEVITSDPALAVEAVDEGFSVDLVASPRLLAASHPSLRVHSSFANLQADLASRPMK